MAERTKPHLYRQENLLGQWLWICLLNGICGSGETPKQAYLNWQKYRDGYVYLRSQATLRERSRD